MPMTEKGKKIMSAMKKQYGAKKGKQVFYASKNKGKIKGVEKKHGGMKRNRHGATCAEKPAWQRNR